MTVETCPVCKGEGAVNDTPWVMDDWWWCGNAYPCSTCEGKGYMVMNKND
jgi:DnaJ-class molecular chaperone